MAKSLLALAAAALVLAVPAAAHVTVDAEAYTRPVVVGQPFNLTVLFSEPCFEMPLELLTGNDELTAILDPSAPSFAKSTAGQSVPWTIEDCPTTDPTARLVQAANLTVVVDAFAPGLKTVAIPVNYRNANGESGGKFDVNVTIAYFANGTVQATQASGHGGHHGNGTAIAVVVDYVTNAESLLSFEVTSSVGSVGLEAASIAVTPPSFDNKSSARHEVGFDFEPPTSWSSATVTVQAFLAPKAGGEKVPVGTSTLVLTNEADEHAEGEGHEHDEVASAEDAPALSPILLAVALMALAVATRRQK